MSTYIWKGIAKLTVLSFPSAVCSFSSCYLIPTLCHLPRIQCNRRSISAVLTESFSKFERHFTSYDPPSFCYSCFLYSANLTIVINRNYANVKWQKSHLQHIGKICIKHMPEAALLSLGITVHGWPALSRRQYHTGTHIFNSHY